jgi:peptidoglycan hydrolase-like protein with peptidoglycan-binding domain
LPYYLIIMKPGDRGDDIKDLQRALQHAADPLPSYGADGHFGGETMAAVASFCESLGLKYDGGELPAEILSFLGLERTPTPPSLGVRVYDLRDQASDPHPKARSRNGKTVRRDPSAITGIVLHQAGVEFGPPAKDPSEIGLARRALTVACHAMAFDGFAVLAAPMPWHIYHADALNPTTIGIEVAGLFPGLQDRAKPGDSVLTDGLIAAAREGIRLLLESARAAGCPIRWIYAHRQADSWRRADPGEGLWRAVVLEYAVPVLGLATRPGYSLPDPQREPKRHGLAIPIDWDPDGVGSY